MSNFVINKVCNRSGGKSSHLINEVNFQKLIDLKESIYQKSEVSPSISKLINMIIDQADLEVVREKLLKRFS